MQYVKFTASHCKITLSLSYNFTQYKKVSYILCEYIHAIATFFLFFFFNAFAILNQKYLVLVFDQNSTADHLTVLCQNSRQREKTHGLIPD